MLRDMPAAYPDHLEAGTANAPGIAALLAGIEWIRAHGVDSLHRHAVALKRRLRQGFCGIPGIRVISPESDEGVAIVTLVAEQMDVPTLAARLDKEHGVLTRPGLHCAPEAHRVLGTEKTGAVRFSLGWSTTDEEVERAIDAVAQVAGVRKVFAVSDHSAALDTGPDA
jgi:selenocysteine lyase/cysteine desulfurase